MDPDVIADEADENSVLASDDEDEVWRAMKASMPKPDMDDIDDEADSQIDIDEEEDSSLDMNSDEDDQLLDGAAGEDDIAQRASAFSDEDGDSEGFEEEAEDLLDSDVDMNIVLGGEDEAEQGPKTTNPQRKKRKLKHLPLFGTAEDYAKLLGDSDDENL